VCVSLMLIALSIRGQGDALSLRMEWSLGAMKFDQDFQEHEVAESTLSSAHEPQYRDPALRATCARLLMHRPRAT
jgi:hypothetical protein